MIILKGGRAVRRFAPIPAGAAAVYRVRRICIHPAGGDSRLVFITENQPAIFLWKLRLNR